MSEQIDRDIAGLEKEPAGFRRRKLAGLPLQIAVLQTAFGGEESAVQQQLRPETLAEPQAAQMPSPPLAPSRRGRNFANASPTLTLSFGPMDRQFKSVGPADGNVRL